MDAHKPMGNSRLMGKGVKLIFGVTMQILCEINQPIQKTEQNYTVTKHLYMSYRPGIVQSSET